MSTDPLTLVLTSSLIAALVSTIATQGIIWLRESRADRREAQFLALRIAITFEKFAEDCVDQLDAIEELDEPGPHGEYAGELPILGELPPPSAPWDKLEASMSASVLGFEQVRNDFNRSMETLWEQEGPPIAGEEQERTTIELGSIASRTASHIRKRYKLPPIEFNPRWTRRLAAYGVAVAEPKSSA